MSIYGGMSESAGTLDGLQNTFATRVQGIQERNQDILNKWQDSQATKIEELTAEQYGDQALGIGKTIETLASGASTAKNFLDNLKQVRLDKNEVIARKKRNRKRRLRKQAGEIVSDEEDEREIVRDSSGAEIIGAEKDDVLAKKNKGRNADGVSGGDTQSQTNTGRPPVSPEETPTDTHIGEQEGGSEEQQPASVLNESPTDNTTVEEPTEEQSLRRSAFLQSSPEDDRIPPLQSQPQVESPPDVESFSGVENTGESSFVVPRRFGDDVDPLTLRPQDIAGQGIVPQPEVSRPLERTMTDLLVPADPSQGIGVDSIGITTRTPDSHFIDADRIQSRKAQTLGARSRVQELEDDEEMRAFNEAQGNNGRLAQLRRAGGNIADRINNFLNPEDPATRQATSSQEQYARSQALIGGEGYARPDETAIDEDDPLFDDEPEETPTTTTPTTTEPPRTDGIDPDIADLEIDDDTSIFGANVRNLNIGRGEDSNLLDSPSISDRVSSLFTRSTTDTPQMEDLRTQPSTQEPARPTQEPTTELASISEESGETSGTLGRIGSMVSRANDTLSQTADTIADVSNRASSAVGTVSDIASSVSSGDVSGTIDKTLGAVKEVKADGSEIGIGGKIAKGVAGGASTVLKYGGLVAGGASFGESLYGEIEAHGKEGGSTPQRVANWASTVSSGLETVGSALDIGSAGTLGEIGVGLNIVGAGVGAAGDAVSDVIDWIDDKKKKTVAKKDLDTQTTTGLEGVQKNPIYQNLASQGFTANISQSALR